MESSRGIYGPETAGCPAAEPSARRLRAPIGARRGKGGRCALKVAVAPALSPGYRRITFVVSDDGIGMSEDYLEHLFEPFVIEGRSRSQGTGLGMSIVRNIVTAAGGDIHVETKLGEGTTFTIVMNRRVAPGGDGDLSSAGDRPRSANVDADGAVAGAVDGAAGAVDGAAGAVGAVAGGGAGAAGGRSRSARLPGARAPRPGASTRTCSSPRTTSSTPR